jgi:carbon storage regulator
VTLPIPLLSTRNRGGLGQVHGRNASMLVLTRRKNQSILIGNDIVVTVLEVKGDQVRVGITAPRDVQVYREELLTSRDDSDETPRSLR